jgi:acetyl-CoA carboxylase carboxyltransferase component
MVWQPEIDELGRRKLLAYEMGGEERIRRHHDREHLTIRERLDLIVDEGSFHERGVLAGKATYEDGELTEFVPSNYVMGLAKIDGRRVVIGGDDFTVRGGAADGSIGGKKGHAERMALEMQLPIIKLVDGTGGGGSVKTIEDIGRTYIPGLAGLSELGDLLSRVPVVAAAMGSVAGIGAMYVAGAHFSVMVRDNSQVFVAGPPVVARGIGREIERKPWTTRRRARRTSSRRSRASSRTCRRTSGRSRRSSRATTRPTGATRNCSRWSRATACARTTFGRCSCACSIGTASSRSGATSAARR